MCNSVIESNAENHLAIRYFGREEIPKNSAWATLPRSLESLGIRVYDPSCDFPPTHVLVIDYLPRDEKFWSKLPVENRFLISTEPVTVNPAQYAKKVTSKFFRVFVPSSMHPRQINTLTWPGGYFNPFRHNVAYANNGKRQGLALINENKFSFVRESNYLLRSKVLVTAMNSGLDISIAGRNWARSIAWTVIKLCHHAFIAARSGRLSLNFGDLFFALYFSAIRRKIATVSRGEVENGVEFLAKHKVAIVIENESSYVSEKLYNALLAGCQCVYVGPKLDPNDFPEGFLFQAEPNVASVIEAAHLALQMEYSISSPQLMNWVQDGKFFKEQSALVRNSGIANLIAEWIGND
jgi:hypothetical protein